MNPHAFVAVITCSVAYAATAIVPLDECRAHFAKITDKGNPQKPYYDRCIRIQPALLVMLSPLTAGYDLGKFGAAGTLVGGIISAAQMDISTSNTGGAWTTPRRILRSRSWRVMGITPRSMHMHE